MEPKADGHVHYVNLIDFSYFLRRPTATYITTIGWICEQINPTADGHTQAKRTSAGKCVSKSLRQFVRMQIRQNGPQELSK